MVHSEKAIVKYHYHSVLSILKTLSHRDTSHFKPVTKKQMAPKEKVAKAPAGTKAKAKAAAKEETKKDKALKKAQKGKHLDLFYI